MIRHENTIFLDVDGVINSITHLYNREDTVFSENTLPYPANGYTVWIPDYMKSLVQAMEKSTNLYWLTTWRENANEFISPILGISQGIPVIDDGSTKRYVDWKFPASLPLAKELHAEGQKIYWVEDFRNITEHSHEPYLTYVDTDARGEAVLLPQHLPEPLLTHLVEQGGYDGPTFVEAPTTAHVRRTGIRNIGV